MKARQQTKNLFGAHNQIRQHPENLDWEDRCQVSPIKDWRTPSYIYHSHNISRLSRYDTWETLRISQHNVSFQLQLQQGLGWQSFELASLISAKITPSGTIAILTSPTNIELFTKLFLGKMPVFGRGDNGKKPTNVKCNNCWTKKTKKGHKENWKLTKFSCNVTITNSQWTEKRISKNNLASVRQRTESQNLNSASNFKSKFF